MRQPRIADDSAVRKRSIAEFRMWGKRVAEEYRPLFRNGKNIYFEFGIRFRGELFTRKILHQTVFSKRSVSAELKRFERRPQQSFSLNRRPKPERPVRRKGNLRFFPGLQAVCGVVAIDAVFPFKLLTVTVVFEIGGKRSTAYPAECVRHGKLSAVDRGNNGEVESCFASVVGDVQDSEEPFPAWSPFGERKIVCACECVIVHITSFSFQCDSGQR